MKRFNKKKTYSINKNNDRKNRKKIILESHWQRIINKCDIDANEKNNRREKWLKVKSKKKHKRKSSRKQRFSSLISIKKNR